MKDDFFTNIMKESNINTAEEIPETNYIDTGSYALNALVSGSIYGGIPGNRAIMWAGAPSAGKSFLTLSCIKTYMDANPDATVLYFDTEFALEKDMIEKRGINVDKFHIVPTETLEDFRTKSMNILDKYEKSKVKPKLLLALDSLSNLPTRKEVEDSLSGHTARDMTKAQVIRSIFRVLTAKLGRCNVPIMVTSHVYSSMDMYSPVVISGGSGSIYAASTIVTLTKAKLKEGNDIIGNIIRATTYKSRYTKENQKIELKLDYKTGLDKFYGLLPIAEKYGIIKKVSTRYELPDGTRVWGKTINDNPSIVYTKEILDKIDKACRKEYRLGSDEEEDLIDVVAVAPEPENAIAEEAPEENV